MEVKSAKQIHPKSLKSLKTFPADYPEASVMLLYRGTDKLMELNFIKKVILNCGYI